MKNLALITGIITISLLINTKCSTKEAKAEEMDVVKMTRELDPFEQIEVNGVFNVFIGQGAKESIIIETEKSAQAAVITEVKDKKLVVSMKDNFDFDQIRKKNIYITVKQLSKVTNKGVGNLESTADLNFKEFALECSGVGNTSLSITLDKFMAEMKSVGNVTLKGKAKEAKINIKGVGNLYAFDFEVDKLDLDFSGVGNSEVNAVKELSINASSVGNLSYKGNAVILKMEHSGVGKIKKY
jgi:hypothetical protein